MLLKIKVHIPVKETARLGPCMGVTGIGIGYNLLDNSQVSVSFPNGPLMCFSGVDNGRTHVVKPSQCTGVAHTAANFSICLLSVLLSVL